MNAPFERFLQYFKRKKRPARRSPASPPFKRKLLFEALEPRLLLSADLLPFPTPLEAPAPLGSQIYHGSVTGDWAAAEVDTYTINLEAGQNISASLDVQDPTLSATIELLRPDGSSLDAAAGTGSLYLQALPVETAGVYKLLVGGGGAGTYSAELILNAPVLEAGEQSLLLSADLSSLASVAAGADEIRAASGTPAVSANPSANVGQEIGLFIPNADSGTRLVFPTIDGNGTRGSVQVAPARIDTGTQTAFFIVPAGAETGNVNATHLALPNFANFPNWNVVDGAVDLCGPGFFDVLPGNSLYVELAGSSSNSGRLESKAEFLLTPGQYELKFSLAGSHQGASDSATVSLGALFSESFTKAGGDAFQAFTRTFTVAADTSARLVFAHNGAEDNTGLIVDNVRLTNLTSGAILVDDAFSFGLPDGPLPLQIVPTLMDADALSGVYHGGSLRLRGTGFIEGAITINLGTTSLVDNSPSVGPNVFFGSTQENDTLDLTVPSAAGFGPLSVTTAGGTSAALVRSFTGIVGVAGSGTAADSAQASANPGQAIVLQGVGLDLTTDVLFQTIDSAGNVGERIVRGTAVNAAGTELTVLVPVDGLTGAVAVVGDQHNTQALLQVVPVITRADLTSVAGNGTSAQVQLRGAGFVEDRASEYSFGATVVRDDSVSSGPDVFFGFAQQNDAVNLTLPLSGDYDGAVTVKTAGGTSAPFSVGFTALQSTALSGTPADAAQASANPGQAVTVLGSALSATSDFIVQRVNSGGVMETLLLNPVFVNAAGTQATLAVPLTFSGAFAVHLLGAEATPLLQIVPQVTSADVTGTSTAQLRGRGFVEGASTYTFAAGSVIDTSASAGPDVFFGFSHDNDAVNLTLPASGAGTLRVTTAGGTSAPLEWNVYHPNRGQLVDVAYNAAANELLVADNNLIRRLDAATGAEVGSFDIPVSGFTQNLGLQILPAAMTLGATVVPAGSLLLTNGTTSFDQIFALNPITGAQIAALNLGQNLDPVAGVYHAGVNELLLLDGSPDEIVRVNPANGAVLGRFDVPFDVNFGGLAIHPVTGNLWVASSQVTRLAEMTPAGVLLREFEVSGQGPATELSGLAFRDADTLLASSTRAVVYVLDLTPATPGAPTLSAINALAAGGTAANAAQASANVGQTIELVGTNFRAGELQAQFATRDAAGNSGVALVSVVTVSVDGTRAQVQVPDLAATGEVRVIGGSGVVTLQIVPTIVGISNGRPGEESSFDLAGSGFMEGASTITIGGVALIDGYTNLADADVFGAQNSVYRLVAPLTLEGPIRVSTAGGFYEIAGPSFAPPSFVALEGLQASAAQGTPADAVQASANTGQTIVLLGQAFTNSTLVQFEAQDDAGTSGVLTRSGSASADGRSLSVVVPALARTGLVRVVGDADTAFALQIVPTLRAVGGSLTPGGTLLLEGSGLIQGELTLTIDGVAIAAPDVRVIGDRGLDQQVIALTVPAGVSAGVVRAASAGGTATWRPAASIAQQSDLAPAADVGDTLAPAQALGLVTNSRVHITESIGDGLDVDLYSVTASAGEMLRVAMSRPSSGGLSYVRLFDAAGVELAADGFSGGGSTPLLFYHVRADGTYYIGASGWSNQSYNPTVARSGTSGATGTYTLDVQRAEGAVTSLSALVATAASGTPAQSAVASANTGQTITLGGAGLRASDTVVFSSRDGAGTLSTQGVTPASVAADGTSLTVVVPTNATSGMVRLAGEQAGVFLQVVPTLADADISSLYHGGTLALRGTGFAEGSSTVHFGAQSLADSGPISGIDVFFGVAQENDRLNVVVPNGVPLGPITVTTLGGTSAALVRSFTGIVGVAGSGTAADSAQASANPGQAIVLQGVGLDLTTDVLFQTIDGAGNVGERIVRGTAVNAAGTELTVLVPVDGRTGAVAVVG